MSFFFKCLLTCRSHVASRCKAICDTGKLVPANEFGADEKARPFFTNLYALEGTALKFLSI